MKQCNYSYVYDLMSSLTIAPHTLPADKIMPCMVTLGWSLELLNNTHAAYGVLPQLALL